MKFAWSNHIQAIYDVQKLMYNLRCVKYMTNIGYSFKYKI